MDNNNFFIGTDDLIKDKSLNDFQALLLMKITALTQERGYAFCSNSYLAKLFGKSNKTISENINYLIKNGYLFANYDEANNRRLVLTKMLTGIHENVKTPIHENVKTPIHENVKHNNKEFNNKEFNNKATEKQINLIKLLNNKLNIDDANKNYNELTKETASIIIEDLNVKVKNKEHDRSYFE